MPQHGQQGGAGKAPLQMTEAMVSASLPHSSASCLLLALNWVAREAVGCWVGLSTSILQ